MSRVVLIGSCPSSGSTLLADLLDSTPVSACGPELGLFAVKNFYNSWEKGRLITKDVSDSPYLLYSQLNRENLSGYGIDLKILEFIFKNSENLREFTTEFSNWFITLRSREPNAITFEKTPQNIDTIRIFLEKDKHAKAVIILRNPLYTFDSLIRRNFSPFLAFLTIAHCFQIAYTLKDNDRVLIVKYEDVVSQPFQTVQKILAFSGIPFDDEETFWKMFKNNTYRYYHDRLRDIILFKNAVWKHWTVQKTGMIKNANDREVSEEIKKLFFRGLNTNLEKFNISDPNDTFKFFGYEFLRQEEPLPLYPSFREKILFLKKKILHFLL
ncbi:MAG: sulfotransferase [Chlorobi bacterium]|nr:sulfotransferase [Chlorobiota bacterium]